MASQPATLAGEDRTEQEPPPPAARPGLGKAGRWALRLGRVALVGQLAWLLAFSTVEYQRGALTWDYSAYNQGRWLIAHGHWYPYSTVLGFHYWRNQGPAFMWVLAPITRYGPGGLLLLWLQAAALSGTGWVALSWVAEHVSTANQVATSPRSKPERFAPWAIGLAAILLTANPGTYIGGAFDFHIEAFASLFAVLTARELFGKARRRVWLWIGLLLIEGSLAGLYLIGIAISGLLSGGSRLRRLSLSLITAGLAWILILSGLHAERASTVAGIYGYLAGGGVTVAVRPGLPQIALGAITHPGRALSRLWYNRVDLWANVAPTGLIGLLNPLTIGMATLVLLSSLLSNGPHLFATPSFQNFPAYPFLVVGTAVLLATSATRSGRHRAARWAAIAARPVCVGLAALSLGWAIVWLPRYPSQWLTVTPAGSQALAMARHLVPPSAEVVVSQGISGRFSDRQAVYPLINAPARFPIETKQVYFVLSPGQGIEIPVQYTESLLAQVASTLGAKLLEHQADIWVFRWVPPPATHILRLQGPQALVPAWTLPTTTSSAVTVGPASLWHVAGDATPGYVIYGDYWDETPGRYVATAEISTTGPANVEVWNANTNTLLARRHVLATSGRETVTIPFDQRAPGARKVFKGWGPFTIAPIPPPPGQPIEIRVFQASGSLVNVYTVGVSQAPSGGVHAARGSH